MVLEEEYARIWRGSEDSFVRMKEVNIRTITLCKDELGYSAFACGAQITSMISTPLSALAELRIGERPGSPVRNRGFTRQSHLPAILINSTRERRARVLSCISSLVGTQPKDELCAFCTTLSV